MKREIIDYFKKNKDEMIKAISELVAVPSVRGTAEEGKPFGKKPYEALMLALKKAESFGFKTATSVRLTLTAASRSWLFWRILMLCRPVRAGTPTLIPLLKRTV